MKKRLGAGASGAVYSAFSACYPNCVLKKGPLDVISREAEAMRYLNHPNVAKLYAEVDLREYDSEGRRVGCLVLQRLGPSLATCIDDPNLWWVSLLLPICTFLRGEDAVTAGVACLLCVMIDKCLMALQPLLPDTCPSLQLSPNWKKHLDIAALLWLHHISYSLVSARFSTRSACKQLMIVTSAACIWSASSKRWRKPFRTFPIKPLSWAMPL